MKVNKKYNWIKNYVFLVIPIIILYSSCEEAFDVKYDHDFTPDQVFVNHDRLRKVGMRPYTYIPVGFNNIGGSFLAGACDEAEHTSLASSIQKFNLGAWNKYTNPDNRWSHYYEGIYFANFFLENSIDYKQICMQDTITANGKLNYEKNIQDIEWLINEVRFLRAFFHFELMKRYGEIPIVKKTLTVEESLSVPRASVSDCIDFIREECDAIKDGLVENWSVLGKSEEYGRVTKGTALALKSRLLLYAASPLYNPDGDTDKWEAAAAAAHELITMSVYKLNSQYRNLFTPPNSYTSDEIIFYRLSTASNSLEFANYPIGTEGGKSGTCPTQNLVDAYEMQSDGNKFDWNNSEHTANPYKNRDPRLAATILYNGAKWNGDTIRSYIGGKDGIDKKEASKTGYYLKKFIVENLDLTQGQKSVHSWIIFRYGEILLNYAEAMNEAYGPDEDPLGYGKTARYAINELRGAAGFGGRRIDVRMPAVTQQKASGKDEMREVIKNERRIELAFEEHRFWDVRRWTKLSDNTEDSEAYKALGKPIYGVKVIKNADNTYSHSLFEVEERKYEKKMLFYPIPQTEIVKYPVGFFPQNEGWE